MKLTITLIFATLLLSACDMRAGTSAETLDKQRTAQQMGQYSVAQPVPQFDFSLERDIVIQLYRARNERVATHTVWRSDLGTIEGDCPSIGYPVPYDTSLTNPLKIEKSYSQGGFAILEQAEPNGIYASKNSNSTWVRCVVEIGGVSHEAPIYIESRVTAYPYPVVVDYDKNRAMRKGTSKPSVVIETN